MAEHGFTPGPWVASYVGAGRRVTPIYSRGRVVAEARDEVGDRCNDFNAQLIAASPTLLEALEGMIQAHNRASQNWRQGLADAQESGDRALAVEIQNGPICALASFPVEAARAAITLATGKDA